MASSELLRLVPEAQQTLIAILDDGRGPVQPPIRSEIFGLQRFAQHGRSLGETHRAALARSPASTFVPRLRDNIEALREAHRYIGLQANTGYDISPAAEWLLDNFHLIEAQLKEIQDGLPRSYFRALPVLLDAPLAGLPRVYGVAWAFVAHTDGDFDEELLQQYLSSYQETRELNLGEMWALPTTLRVVLVENLRRLAERVASNKAAREVANLCSDRIESYSVADLARLLGLLDRRGVGRVFLAQLALRMQDRAAIAAAGDPAGFTTWLQQALPDPSAAQAQQSADQAADNLSVSNAVTSLRAIGDADWTAIVARSNPLMRLMLSSALFESEHNTTRDQTLHGIERWAKRTGRSELAVAQALLGLMEVEPRRAGQRSATDRCDGAVPEIASHWLRGRGRAALAKSLGHSEPAGLRWAAAAQQAALPVYLGALLIGSVGLVVWMLLLHRAGIDSMPVALGWTLLCAGLMLFPASEAVVAVINRLISESLRPQHLPRLALNLGIPAEHRVMVVIPAMLTEPSAIDALAHRLELHHLANPERHAQFALLTDWTDADAARVPGDEALLALATQRIRELNALYSAGSITTPRFIVLHRARRYSESEQCWIGWERKRGKLEQLIAALAEGSSDAFLELGEFSRIAAGTRYLVTLDSDTQLPPGRLRELVGVAAHPANQPRLDASGRRVVAGYGILQPRIVTPLPAASESTLFHWMFAGQSGIDPYSAASSEVYQDVFHEGTFTGKGLLNVQALHASLSGRLPDGRVLSHDLLEGSIARCAAVTDIMLIEDAPVHADVAASRVHRWTRGDWQLLPFLADSKRYRFPAINRWKMFDNLRRSMVAPASLLLVWLLMVARAEVLSLSAAVGLVFAAFAAGPLMGAVAGLSPSRDDVAKRHFYREAGVDLARAVWGGLWRVAQLLADALMSLDAIARSLYRMAHSRRHLLQWTTAEAAQAQATTDLATLVRRHRRVPLVALGLWLVLLALGTDSPGSAFVLCALWAASPVWIWCVSRPRPGARELPLADAERQVLEGIARDTWRLFERCVTAEDNHLPPDNLQTAPFDAVAHRTSPTNIGLYLLSTACARAFGWITTADLLGRLEATLATLQQLQRHRGHFLNWYDTQTRAPLLPMYVSTVDSGNLSGHLLAVAQACRESMVEPDERPSGAARRGVDAAADADVRAGTSAEASAGVGTDVPARTGTMGDDQRKRLRAVAEQCEQLAWQPDFGFLYHRKRQLLHIGYRVAEQQLDAGFYDLLASEARLTSLLAIAKGDVPVAHWAALGRPFFAIGTSAGLRSWSGSMFEYLMPSLVLDEPGGSVLREAGLAALGEQLAFCEARQVPWGISESAYAGRDHTLAYQYAPQGVPRLALRRTPPDELVIAPYATALAAQVSPRQALTNFRAMEALGARKPYGFIEALDYTPGRQSGTDAFAPVETFMAHHQGMSIVALANVLLDGPAQRWGMANAHIEAVASLLHERAPREVSTLSAPSAGPPPQALQRRAPGLLREVMPGETALQPTHLLSNGRYSVALRANGAGWSRWGSSGITRWRDDALRDAHGSFFWLRWDRQPQAVSITQHPAPDPAAAYRSTFHADRVCFDANWQEVQTHTTVWVSPEDDIEFRQIELRNLGERTLEIELMSAFDITLADPRADEAHPAFSNLFISAEWLAAQQALVFERKPRLATERGLQAAHFLAEGDSQVVQLRCQTDRQHWLGRNQDVTGPRASFDTPPNAGVAEATLDTGLDPVCALSVQLRIAPRGSARLTFATAASDNGATLRAVVDKYRQASHVQRASLMSATLTGIRLRELRIGPETLALVQTLTSALVHSLTRPQLAIGGSEGHDPVCDRRLLWRFGISGDRPLLLVSAGVTQGIGLMRSMAQALRVWAWGGIACDLVVVNAEAASYQMAFHRDLAALRDRHLADTVAAPGAAGPSGTSFHLLRADEVSADELSTLQCLARIHLHADGRPLQHHVEAWAELHETAFVQREATSTVAVPIAAPAVTPVQAAAGRFSSTATEFRFEAGGSVRPQRPWINVLSNPRFGAQVSEAGGGYTWAVNSRMNQLTAWSNDPVGDPSSEWFLLQDRRSLQTWSVTPSAWGDERLAYRIAHAQGSTTIGHRRGDAEVTATWCVDAESSVKQVVLRITNRGTRTLHLRAIGIAEWVMGQNRGDRASVHTALYSQRLPDAKLTALMCTQRERSGGFGDGTAFLAMAGPESQDGGDADWTCDRRECFDARGRLVLPDHFDRRSGSGLDPCAALASSITLPVGDSVERVFLLGYADSPAAARELAARSATVPSRQRQDAVRARWEVLLGATTVKTPDPLFDAMVNRWLLYQTVSSRLWAKAGFYQAGGATGFRDQLQDSMALAWAAPAMLREQIAVCASRQFAEGDVQHWWHAPGGAGVRTHFSDDLLWLPYACAHHLNATGDRSLLDEQVPFLEGPGIPEGAEDAYYAPTVGRETASVYEHAARSIDRSLHVGAHGLPLMGTGDWNDGMNRVGHEGRGESVWLGWFLCRVVADFAPLARERGDIARAQRWEDAAQGWKAALNGPAWDGQWFKRAYFDNGEALGSHANAEARIDLIAQAWSVLSQAAPADLQRQALTAVESHLIDAEAGLIRLLDPPLQKAEPSAGYIQAYPPGVRENGGQYSHAGVWAMMARAEWHRNRTRADGRAPGLSDGGDAVYRDFTWLSPAHRAAHSRRGPVYGIEPYVMAGDIYSQPPYVGRGGWSWYTGAAAWMHRAAIESIFGLRQSGDSLCFQPCLPTDWPWAELTLKRDGRNLRFILARTSAAAALDPAAAWRPPVGSRLLRCAQVLAWPTLPGDTCWVVPLLEPPAPGTGGEPGEEELPRDRVSSPS